MISESEILFILTILDIDSSKTVATVTELGVKTYLAHSDQRVCRAMKEYLANPQSKSIAKIRIPAQV